MKTHTSDDVKKQPCRGNGKMRQKKDVITMPTSIQISTSEQIGTNVSPNNNSKPHTPTQQLGSVILYMLQQWQQYVETHDTETPLGSRTARCPCEYPQPHKHGDANPSLQVSLFLPDDAEPAKKDAWGLYIRCLAGHGHDHQMIQNEAGDAILAAFGEWKGITLETLKRAGVQVEISEKNRVSIRFRYRDGSVHVRRLPKAWAWENGKNSNDKLYDLLEDLNQDYCILVEGESDTLVLADAGFNVVGRTCVNALLAADKKFVELSRKYQRLYISVEDDQESNPELQGKLQTLQQKSAGAEIYAIHWANHGVKDPSELRIGLGDPNQFIQTVQTAMQTAERVVVQPKQKTNRQAVLAGPLSQQLRDLFPKYAFTPNLQEIARRLVRSVLTDDFKFVCADRKTLDGYFSVWDDERKLWVATNPALHTDWVRQTVRQRLELCQPNSDAETNLLKDLSAILGDERPITLAFKEAVQDIIIDEHAFLLDREYIPCQNILLRVEPSGEITEQDISKDYPIRWHLNTIYDPHADAPLWREHLNKVCRGDPELVREILRAGGLALTGYRTRYIYWLHGGGRNGKTTTIGVLCALLGPRMSVTLPANAFAARKDGDAEPYLWGARHVRLMVVNETPDRADLDIEKLKALTDDNADSNRAIRGVFMNIPEEFIWRPQFSLIFTSNRKPVLPHKTDQAFYDRLRLLPFNYRFDESEMRPNYTAALLQEAPGILNTLLWGLTDALAHPHWMSQTAFMAVQERRMEQDVVYAWFKEQCVVTHQRKDMVAKDDIYRDFMEWCETLSLSDEWNGAERRFTQQLIQILIGLGVSNPYDRMRQQDGKRGWFHGLRLKSPQDPNDALPQHVGRDAVVDMVEAWLRGETGLQFHVSDPRWSEVPESTSVTERISGRDNEGGRDGGRDVSALMHYLDPNSEKSPRTNPMQSGSIADLVTFPKLPSDSALVQNSASTSPDRVHAEAKSTGIDCFISKCCDVGGAYVEKFDDLYAAYQSWCEERGAQFESKQGFGRALTARSFPVQRRGRQKTTYRLGLRLKPESYGQTDPVEETLQAQIQRWDDVRVVYEAEAKEKLSVFVEDFLSYSQSERTERICDSIANWLEAQGCSLSHPNSDDALVVGARLWREEDDPFREEHGKTLLQTDFMKRQEQKKQAERATSCSHQASQMILELDVPTPVELREWCRENDTKWVDTDAALLAAVQEWLKAGTVALDTETTGLNPRTDRLRLVQVATPEGRCWLVDAWAVDVRLLQPMLEQCEIVGHNLKFDLQFLMAAGLTLPVDLRVFDTMLAARVLEASNVKTTQRHFGLETVLERCLRVKINKDKQNDNWNMKALPLGHLEYARQDVVHLVALREALSGKLQCQRLQDVMNLENRFLLAITEIEWAGVPVDESRWLAVFQRDTSTLHSLEQELNAMVRQAVRWTNAEQVKAVLQAHGIQTHSVSEDVLVEHAGNPLVDKYLEWKGYYKRVSTFGEKFVRHIHNGRVHPDWKQIGADTGRMSCTQPNLQQIPRDGGLRDCIRAPQGRILVIADYAQIELRIAAEIAQDPKMIESFNRGDDLHTLTATLVLGKQKVTKADRQEAKAVNFGLLYGMGANGLRSYAKSNYGVDMTPAQAERFREQFFKVYVGLARWHDDVRHEVQEAIRDDGWYTALTLFGRKRRLFSQKQYENGAPQLPFTEALNTPVQGTGADGLKLAVIRLRRELREQFPTARVILLVHDEIVVECDEQDAEQVRLLVENCMREEMARLLKQVPVEVESVVSRAWIK